MSTRNAYFSEGKPRGKYLLGDIATDGRIIKKGIK
jgi:hypothetical protein